MTTTTIRREAAKLMREALEEARVEANGPSNTPWTIDILKDCLDAALAALDKAVAPEQAAPIPMLLFCPQCGHQHVDAPEPESGWTNPPHTSHLCANCKCVWRQADVPTDGVARLATYGSRDTWGVKQSPPIEQAAQEGAACEGWRCPGIGHPDVMDEDCTQGASENLNCANCGQPYSAHQPARSEASTGSEARCVVCGAETSDEAAVPCHAGCTPRTPPKDGNFDWCATCGGRGYVPGKSDGNAGHPLVSPAPPSLPEVPVALRLESPYRHDHSAVRALHTTALDLHERLRVAMEENARLRALMNRPDETAAEIDALQFKYAKAATERDELRAKLEEEKAAHIAALHVGALREWFDQWGIMWEADFRRAAEAKLAAAATQEPVAWRCRLRGVTLCVSCTDYKAGHAPECRPFYLAPIPPTAPADPARIRAEAMAECAEMTAAFTQLLDGARLIHDAGTLDTQRHGISKVCDSYPDARRALARCAAAITRAAAQPKRAGGGE